MFLPGKSQGQGNLAGYSPWDHNKVGHDLATKQQQRVYYRVVSKGAKKAMAPQSSTLAWKVPWTEEPGRLQSMGSLRVGHD